MTSHGTNICNEAISIARDGDSVICGRNVEPHPCHKIEFKVHLFAFNVENAKTAQLLNAKLVFVDHTHIYSVCHRQIARIFKLFKGKFIRIEIFI